MGTLSSVRRRARAPLASATIVVMALLGAVASVTPTEAAGTPHDAVMTPPVLALFWAPATTHDTTSSNNYSNDGVSCVSSTFCMSVGYDAVSLSSFGEEWNGTVWNEVATAAPAGAYYSSLYGVSCVSTSFCEAVGNYKQTSSSGTVNYAEMWNGTSWVLQTIPAIAGSTQESLNAVSCVNLTFCLGTGSVAFGASGVPLSELWNGTTWSYVPAGSANDGVLNGVSCSLTTFCAAVGDYQVGSTGTVLVENWNGTSWVTAPSSSVPPASQNYLAAVSCTGPTFCAATGSGYVAGQGNSYTTLMEIWNGSTWSVRPSPNLGTDLGNFMYGISCVSATSCSAVGSLYTNSADSQYQNEAFVWNGSTWEPGNPAYYAYPAPRAGQQAVSCVSDWACMAVGYAANASGTFAFNMMSPMSRNGYRFAASDGGVFDYGAGAPFYGSLGGTRLNAPIVGLGVMPAGDGYYLVASDGGVFAYGSAQFYGSMGGKPLNEPIVGIAVTADGGGYWLVASDGGVFAYGDAQFFGSTGGRSLNKPVVGIASAPNGLGYWLVASDGGIFNYGPAAPFFGSTGGTVLNEPIVGIGATTSGQYYLVASDGGIFAFPQGTAGPPFYGSMGGKPLNKPIVGMTVVQGGYYLSGSDGGIFAFPTGGNGLPFYGSTGGTALNKPIVGVAS